MTMQYFNCKSDIGETHLYIPRLYCQDLQEVLLSCRDIFQMIDIYISHQNQSLGVFRIELEREALQVIELHMSVDYVILSSNIWCIDNPRTYQKPIMKNDFLVKLQK